MIFTWTRITHCLCNCACHCCFDFLARFSINVRCLGHFECNLNNNNLVHFRLASALMQKDCRLSQTHTSENDIRHRAAIRAGIPAIKEPHRHSWNYSKKWIVYHEPFVAQSLSHLNVAVADTLTTSYLRLSAVKPASGAEASHAKKSQWSRNRVSAVRKAPRISLPTLAERQHWLLQTLETMFLHQRVSMALIKFSAVNLAYKIIFKSSWRRIQTTGA